MEAECKLDFPSDVLKFLKKNANPQMALKLMQVCKYFQHKEFPWFVIKKLVMCNYRRVEFDNESRYSVESLEEISSKQFWLTEDFNLTLFDSLKMPSFFEKIAVCEVKKLWISSANISLNEFIKISNNVKNLTVDSAKITMDEEGTLLKFPEIFQYTPKLKGLDIHCTSEIWEFENADVPFVPNVKSFQLAHYLGCVPFDVDWFCKFMLKNSHIKYKCRFPRLIKDGGTEVRNKAMEKFEKVKRDWPKGNVMPHISVFITDINP